MKSPSRIDFLAVAPGRVLGFALLAASVFVLAWQGFAAARELQLLERERAGLAALASSRAPTSVGMSAEDRRRHAQMEALARYLAAPWAELLGAFEERRAGQAVLQRIEQDAATGTLRITARARHAEAMMAYVRALEADRRVGAVLLHRHEPEEEQPGAALRFEISANWPGGGDPRAAAAAQAAAPAGERP